MAGKDYLGMTKNISKNIVELYEERPELGSSFRALAKASMAEGALDQKTKELIAIAVGVTARCDGCIGFHVKAALKLGATREEILDVLGIATYMGGGPALMYVANAVEALNQFSAES